MSSKEKKRHSQESTYFAILHKQDACQRPHSIHYKKMKKEKKISSFDTFQVRQHYQTHLVGTNRDLPYQNKCSEPSHLVFP